MSFLRRLAQSGIAQSASNAAQAKISQAVAGRIPQAPAQAPPPQAPPPTQVQPVTQPQAPRGPSVVENALAGLMGSAERFIDHAGSLIGICPSCQTPTTANTACEQCGTHVPPNTVPNQAATAAAPAARASNCGNCGATIKGDICEYCESRT